MEALPKAPYTEDITVSRTNGSFALRKCFSFTYSQYPGTNCATLATVIASKFPVGAVIVLVTEENHKDNEGVHYHGYVCQTNSKQRIQKQNASFMNIARQHPHLAQITDHQGWYRYCTKQWFNDDHTETMDPKRHSISDEMLQSGKIATVGNYNNCKKWNSIIKTPRVKDFEHIKEKGIFSMRDLPLNQVALVKRGYDILERALREAQIDRSKDVLKIVKHQGYVFFDRDVNDKQRHYWIWGLSNTGKTHFVYNMIGKHINVSALAVGDQRVISESDPKAPILCIDDPGDLSFNLLKSLARDYSKLDVKYDTNWADTKGRILIILANQAPEVFFKAFVPAEFNNAFITCEFTHIFTPVINKIDREVINFD